jgi:Uma2 family endonuclease
MTDMLTGERIILNYRDYCALPNDGRRYEILDGELSVSPSPKTRHQRVAFKLGRILSAHVPKFALGEILMAPLDVVLDDFSVVQPDLIFVAKANLEIIGEDNIRGAPNLLVEVLPPTNPDLDLRDKRQLYAKHGVPWYWIVDPDERTVLELERLGDTYREVSQPGGHAVFTPIVFARMNIPLAEVWS